MGPKYGQPILGVTEAKTSTATAEDRWYTEKYTLVSKEVYSH
jgi:hypothetical protein